MRQPVSQQRHCCCAKRSPISYLRLRLPLAPYSMNASMCTRTVRNLSSVRQAPMPLCMTLCFDLHLSYDI